MAVSAHEQKQDFAAKELHQLESKVNRLQLLA
jgi:hypothetical protein